MTHLTVVILDEFIDYLDARVITNAICSAMGSFHAESIFFIILYYFENEHSDERYIPFPLFVFIRSPFR